MKRRRLLRVGAASSVLAFTGCASSGDTETPGDGSTGTDDGATAPGDGSATVTPTTTLGTTAPGTTTPGTTNEDATETATTETTSDDETTSTGGDVQDAREDDAKIPASNGKPSDLYGYAVAIDGDTIVIGAPGRDADGVGGLAHVFERTNGTWTQQSTLLRDDGESGDGFGAAVAVADDTVAIGAPEDRDSGGDATGSAYIYERTDGSWSRTAKLTDETRSEDDAFGYGIETDGERVFVSAHRDWDPDEENYAIGSISVFGRTADGWGQDTVIRPSDGSQNDQFGMGLSLSGETVVVGASTKTTSHGELAGAAYVLARNGDSWQEQTRLTPESLDAFDRFGRCTAHHGDVALVTAQKGDTDDRDDIGSLYVLERSNGTWSPTRRLGPVHTNKRRESGDSVGVDDRFALHRAVAETPNGNYRNVVTVYRHDDAFEEHARLVAGDGDDDDKFASAVAIDDGTVVVGAQHDEDPNGEFAGSAYVYEL